MDNFDLIKQTIDLTFNILRGEGDDYSYFTTSCPNCSAKVDFSIKQQKGVEGSIPQFQLSTGFLCSCGEFVTVPDGVIKQFQSVRDDKLGFAKELITNVVYEKLQAGGAPEPSVSLEEE
jgi:hypothetical protein